MLKYYGADWAQFLFVFIHMWMLGNKSRSAFVMGFAACMFGLCLGCMIDSLACMVMNVVFAAMHIRNFFKWSGQNCTCNTGSKEL